jgi:hypothetical protein
MSRPTFQSVVCAASDMAPSKGRSKLVNTLHTAKLEWDEDERKQLRRDNKDGFLLAPEGAVIGVHLNLNKRPFFNLKQPRKYGGQSDFPFQTLGHVRALVLADAHFYVGLAGSKKTAQGGGSKSPYAGPVGTLVAAEVPGDSFGTVPKSGSNLVTFNPRAFPEWRSLFFCIDDDAPVKGASKVIMRDWKIWASGPRMMPDKEIESTLEKLGLTREDMGSGGRVASFIQQEGVRSTPTFNDDPQFWAVRNDLIRIAYTNPETRKALLPLLTE